MMDIQMPTMDGYTATAAIREDERFQHLPILAMSAHVLAAERERCLEAGMNDFIFKPIDPELMFTVLRRWIPIASAYRAAAEAKESALRWTDIDGLDTAAGLRRVAGNEALYRSMLLDLVRLQTDTMSALLIAVPAAKLQEVANLAHRLRGVAGNLGATAIQEHATELESCARQGRIADVSSALNALEQSWKELCPRILASVDPLPMSTSKSVPSSTLHSDEEKRALRRLASELENQDGAAPDSLQTLLALLSESRPTGHYEKLSRLVRDFDFEAALAELRSIESITLS